MRETNRYEITIADYLKGCKCAVISFEAGGFVLFMTDENSALLYPNHEKFPLSNDLYLVRHYEKDTNELIEIEIIKKTETISEQIFYMMYPTGTFIHNE